jgi:proteasome lid subunit RPN8/RPN11
MIRFSLSAQQIMLNDAGSGFPDEVCGFLYGREDSEGNRQISEAREVLNAKDGDKRRRFEISPKDYMQAEKYAADHDLELLGVYHSHPNHPAIPSEHDRVAAQPFFSYVIVSVRDGLIDHSRSWRLNEESQFEEETLAAFALESAARPGSVTR